jgi:hypothetical protein
MATRPVFVPEIDPNNPQLVHVHEVDFQWLPGRDPQQIKANIAKLHGAAGHRKLEPLLHVSPDSDDPLGIRISATNLVVEGPKSYLIPLIAAFQGSKVFTGGGPFTDLYRKREAEIVADPRLVESGNHLGFRFRDLEWGKKAETMFYDWLVLHAIHRHQKLASGIRRFKGFTDVECLTGGQVACHARSCALYAALAEKKLLDKMFEDQDLFITTLMKDTFYLP